MTPAEVIQQRLVLREGLAHMAADFEEQCKPYKEAADALDAWMLGYLNENVIQNVKTEYGTAFKSTVTSVKMADRLAFMNFIVDAMMACDTHDEALAWTSFFTAAVNKDAVNTFIESKKTPPPGIDTVSINKCNFRKPNEK